MATQVQWRRGTAAQVAAFTGAVGEIVVSTDTHRLNSNDGATVGGFPVALVSDVTALTASYGVAGGAADALTLTLSPVPSGYGNGANQVASVWFKASANNVTTTPTLNVNGLGAKTMQKYGGAMAAGDIVSGRLYEATYDGTNFQVLNVQPAVPTGTNATVTNPMTTNLVLTSSSSALETVNPTVAGLSITLPDATTMPTLGTGVFTIINIGIYPLQILNSAGTLIGHATPGQRLPIALENKSTAAGQWRFVTGDLGKDNGIAWWGALNFFNGATTGSGGASLSIMLSVSFGIFCYYDGTDIVCRGFQVDGSMVNMASSSVQISAAANWAGLVDGVALSSAEALVIYSVGTTTVVRTLDLNTSTLVVTVNGTASVVAAASTSVACDVISSSLAFIGYASGGNTKVATVSISAGTCTVNTAQTVGATASVGMAVAVLSATLAHIVYNTNAPAGLVCHIGITGTTVAPGTPVSVGTRSFSVASASTYQRGMVALSATASLAIADGGSGYPLYGEVLTDTGSTITPTETQLSLAGNTLLNGGYLYGASPGTNGTIIAYAGPTAPDLITIKASGTTAVVGPMVPPTADLFGAAGTGSSSAPAMASNYTKSRMRFVGGIGVAGGVTSTGLWAKPICIA